MAVLQDININVHGQPSEKRLQTFLRLSQNENGRLISFRVLGPPLPSNCTATFSGTKPDGNVYSKTGTVTGNFVIIEEDIQMTAVAGVWDAKLDIINGTHNIMTALIRVVVDADVVDPDAIASDSQLQGLVAETKYYAEHARTDAYGSPLTAPTKAQMTDHTRVYVYTGSEPNMVAGNWYLWNGSAWVSGGVYNAVAVQTDTTLSVAGKAADGKATGDKIEELKEELNGITDITITETSGYINTSGGISAASETNQEVYTNRIKVNAGDKLRLDISYPNAVRRWAGYGLYTASGAWMERIILISDSTGSVYTADITIPENAGFIAFTYRTFGNENVANVSSLSPMFEDVRNLESGLQSANTNIEVIANEGITLSASDLQQGEWTNGAISSTTSRLCTKVLYPVTSGMVVNYNTSANLNVAIRIFDKNGVQIEGSAWLGGTDSAETYTVRTNGYMGIVFKRTSGSYISTGNYTTWGAVTNIQNSLSGIIGALAKQNTNKSCLSIGKVETVLKPMYDHLFVNSGESAVIPHESLYHVRLSKRLGFNVIEANIAQTSDGVYIVNHLNNGAFGTYFHHVDGTTNISTTLVSSVTWEWIETNVRYNSTIPKYRTRPCRLEEFLGECKQQGLIPLVMITSQEVLDIVESYMGANNYIAYGGTRTLCPDAIIFQWRNDATKDAIVKYCRGIGTPMIYGMSNTGAFTETELREIATALHAEGYWLGTSYNDAAWYRLSNCGFDIIGTQRMINRIEHGNKYNIDSIFGFSGYQYTNATELDGVLTFTADGTLSPDISNDVLLVGGADLQISFSGEITVPAFGELTSVTYTRDYGAPLFLTTPLINKSPKLTLNVVSGTVIRECTYRIMEC